jgi:ketosteroid isomerase-like protein
VDPAVTSSGVLSGQSEDQCLVFRRVASLTERANSAGNQLAAPAAHVWRIADGKLAEFTNYYADQAAVDRFWQQAG